MKLVQEQVLVLVVEILLSILRENNWLGEGKQLDFAVDFDEESLSGRLNFTDPNYDFLGNSLNYIYIKYW